MAGGCSRECVSDQTSTNPLCGPRPRGRACEAGPFVEVFSSLRFFVSFVWGAERLVVLFVALVLAEAYSAEIT